MRMMIFIQQIFENILSSADTGNTVEKPENGGQRGLLEEGDL